MIEDADTHNGVVDLELLLVLLLSDAEDGVVALKVAVEDEVDGEECVVGDRKSDRIVAFKVAEGGVVVIVLAIEDVDAEECAVVVVLAEKDVAEEDDRKSDRVVVVLAEEGGVVLFDDRKSDRKLVVKERGHEAVVSDRCDLVASLSRLE